MDCPWVPLLGRPRLLPGYTYCQSVEEGFAGPQELRACFENVVAGVSPNATRIYRDESVSTLQYSTLPNSPARRQRSQAAPNSPARNLAAYPPGAAQQGRSAKDLVRTCVYTDKSAGVFPAGAGFPASKRAPSRTNENQRYADQIESQNSQWSYARIEPESRNTCGDSRETSEGSTIRRY